MIIFQIYFYLVFFMVMSSIVSMAYSTEPSMRRPVSECEMLEYMEHSENEHTEKVGTWRHNLVESRYLFLIKKTKIKKSQKKY